MTDKLKCPFCEAELKPLLECGTPVGWGCPNFCKTRCALDEPVWQALIDGKKAQDAIQKIKDIVYPALDSEFYSELRNDMLNIGRIIVSVKKQEE